MRLRKIVIGVAAIGSPFTVMSTVVGVGAAWAVTGTGHVSCSKIMGTLTFKPPLKMVVRPPKSPPQRPLRPDAAGAPNPTKVMGVSTHKGANNSCANLGSATAVTIKLTYSPSVTASTFKGTATGTTSPPGFTLSGSVTGSYASTSASATVLLKQTSAGILWRRASPQPDSSPSPQQERVVTLLVDI